MSKDIYNRRKAATRQSSAFRPQTHRWEREGGWVCNNCGGNNWLSNKFCDCAMPGKGIRCGWSKAKSRQMPSMGRPLKTVMAEKGLQEGPELRLEKELPREEESPLKPRDNAIPKMVCLETENPRSDSADTVLDTTRVALDLAEDKKRKRQAVEYLKWKLDKSIEKERLLEGYLAHQYLATNAYRELQDRELTTDNVSMLLQKKESEKTGIEGDH